MRLVDELIPDDQITLECGGSHGLNVDRMLSAAAVGTSGPFVGARWVGTIGSWRKRSLLRRAPGSRFRCVRFDQRGVGASERVDGRYDLEAYMSDIEALRRSFGLDSWHVLSHSRGGLLAQVYAAPSPQQVRSLVLSSSSLGVGDHWKRTKREAFRTDRQRAGLLGMLRFNYGAGLHLPGAGPSAHTAPSAGSSAVRPPPGAPTRRTTSEAVEYRVRSQGLPGWAVRIL